MAADQNQLTKKEKDKCLVNAFYWVFFNVAFGLIPVIFLLILNAVVIKWNEEIRKEVNHLLHGGIVLFICCSLMGAVIVDVIIEKLSLKLRTNFFILVFPFFYIGGICFGYFLMLVGGVPDTFFTNISLIYVIVILSALAYCVYGKYRLYVRQELKRKEGYVNN